MTNSNINNDAIIAEWEARLASEGLEPVGAGITLADEVTGEVVVVESTDYADEQADWVVVA